MSDGDGPKSCLPRNIMLRRVFLYGHGDCGKPLAEMLNLSLEHYRQIEHGRIIPDDQLIQRIAERLLTTEAVLTSPDFNAISGQVGKYMYMHENFMAIFKNREIAIACIREWEITSGYHPLVNPQNQEYKPLKCPSHVSVDGLPEPGVSAYL